MSEDEVVVDANGKRIREGSRVRADWPGAIGTVTRISEWDGEYIDGRTVGHPPRVFVRWDNVLTNDGGQEWQDEDFHTTQDHRDGADRCEELELAETEAEFEHRMEMAADAAGEVAQEQADRRGEN